MKDHKTLLALPAPSLISMAGLMDIHAPAPSHSWEAQLSLSRGVISDHSIDTKDTRKAQRLEKDIPRRPQAGTVYAIKLDNVS